ncbi:MAG: YSC84-related protein [Pseudomonadota bacterium]|jgi:lipid-binding SYLF domain-containing protein
MLISSITRSVIAIVSCAVFLLAISTHAQAESAKELRTSARQALQSLYRTSPGAAALGKKAAGVLVFPQIMRAGFGVGGHYGNGVLFKGKSAAGYYNTTAASFGFQIGAETFGYAIFFMSQKDLNYLSNSAGWEIGAGASITVLDQALAESISSSTIQEGIYAAVFAQQGLMGGVSLEGTKITRYTPSK